MLKFSGIFQFSPLHHHQQNHGHLGLDSSAVKFPGYSAHHDVGLIQARDIVWQWESLEIAFLFSFSNLSLDCHITTLSHGLRSTNLVLVRLLTITQPILTPDQLDAVIIDAKQHHREAKQLSFPDQKYNCAGYSMLGCVWWHLVVVNLLGNYFNNLYCIFDELTEIYKLFL